MQYYEYYLWNCVIFSCWNMYLVVQEVLINIIFPYIIFETVSVDAGIFSLLFKFSFFVLLKAFFFSGREML